MKKSFCFCLCSLSFYNGMWWPNQPLQQTANLNQTASFKSTGFISCFLILCLSWKKEELRTEQSLPIHPNSMLPRGRRQTCRYPVLLEMEDALGLFSGRVQWPRHTSSERLVLPALSRQYRKNANLRRRTYHHRILVYTSLLPDAWHSLRRVERWIP